MLAILKRISTSNHTFAFLGSSVCISLFLDAGFISISVITLFVFCVVNAGPLSKSKAMDYTLLFLPIFLLILYLLWSFFSSDTAQAIDMIFRKIWLLLIPLGFLLIGNISSQRELHIVLFTFLIACILCSFVCYANAIFNTVTQNSFSLRSEDRTYYYFSYYLLTEPVNISPIYLSLFCNFGFVVALKTPLIKGPWIRIITVIYMALFIFMITAKIGIISLVLVSVVCFVMIGANRKLIHTLWISAVVSILLLTIYKFPFLKDRFITSTQFDYAEPYGHAWNSVTYRLAIWSCSLEAIKRETLLGYGTADGQKALEIIYKEKGFAWGLQESYNPHNEFLSVMLDLGVLGVCVLSLIFIAPFIQSFRSRDTLGVCFLIITFLFFSTESVLLRQKGIVFFCFFYSLLFWSLLQNKKGSPSKAAQQDNSN